MKLGIYLFSFLIFWFPLRSQICINEFLAANQNSNSDEAGEFDDWIEIYNMSDDSVDLSGIYLTDDFSNPTKWQFPQNFTIPAKDFLIIWADDDTEQDENHANFKLDADGEQLALYDGSKFIDSLSFGEQNTDVSFGRFPDGAISWKNSSTPTPGAKNIDANWTQSAAPVFSVPAGFFNNPVAVEINTSSNAAKIYYTTDGSEPTETSPIYTNPISLSQTTALRARAFESGSVPSEISTATYIFNYDFEIPTISLVTDSENLWNENSGIYVNPKERGSEWERPVSMEFYNESGEVVESLNGGIRIHGGVSRNYDKKSFRLYFRDEYGAGSLKLPLFDAKPNIQKFERLVLNCGSTDMPNFPEKYAWTLIRNSLGQAISQNVDEIFVAIRPVALFLNGEPWGIYYLSEKTDENFTDSNFNEPDIDLIETTAYGYEVKVGTIDEWNRLLTFADENNLSYSDNYKKIQSLIDLQNFTDYQITEIYLCNTDWPLNNVLAFRPQREDGKWRWIVWDVDHGLGYFPVSTNTLEYTVADDEMTILFRKLLENTDYRQYFINRFADLLNSVFLPDNVNCLVDSLAAEIEHDVAFETDRWGDSPEIWKQNVEKKLVDFANERPKHLWKHLKEMFDLGNTTNLTLKEPQGGPGKIRINSLYPTQFPWTAEYFREFPIELEALPGPGYRFVQWSISSVSQAETITINFSGPVEIYPVFEKFTPDNPVVINEINYNSAPDFAVDDWIELYNYSDEDIDVSGWHFKDKDDAHDFVLPDGCSIAPQGYLVLCQKIGSFQIHFPDITSIIGNFDFGLDNKGESIFLYDRYWNLVDSLAWQDQSPWPEEPDGTGATLALRDPLLDNSIPENWSANPVYGSPAKPNTQLEKPVIRITPDSLNFMARVDSVDTFSKTIIINNEGKGELSWKAEKIPEANWFTLSKTAGQAGDSLDVMINPESLEPGTYTGLILFYDINFHSDSVMISIKLILNPALEKPIIQVSPESLNFVTTVDSIDSFSKTIIIKNTGKGELSWKAEKMSEANWFTLSKTAGQAGDSLDVVIIPESLEPGTYTGLILFYDINFHSDSVKISIKLILNPALEKPIIQVSPDSLNFVSTVDSIDSFSKTIIIKNTGKGELSWKAEKMPEANWFTLSKTAGQAGDSLDVVITPESLEPGTYTSLILVYDLNYSSDSVRIPVQLILNPPSLVAKQTGSRIPEKFNLFQNYPNPFNPEAKIIFEIPEITTVRLTIYNSIGQVVKTIVLNNLSAGSHSVSWDGTDNTGLNVQSGIYFCQMQAAQFSKVIKMVLVQ